MASPPLAVGAAVGAALSPFAKQFAWSTGWRAGVAYAGPHALSALSPLGNLHWLLSLNTLSVLVFAALVRRYWASRSAPMLFTCAVSAFVLARAFGKFVLVSLLLDASGGRIFSLQQALTLAQLASFVACEAAAIVAARAGPGAAAGGAPLAWLAGRSVWFAKYRKKREEAGGADAAFVARHAALLALNAASLALLHYLVNFQQPYFSHHIGGVFFEGTASSSSLQFLADRYSWTAAAGLPKLLGLRRMAARAYDLRLMASLPPVLFMGRRELYLFKVLGLAPRCLIIAGDLLLRAFGILSQVRAGGMAVGDSLDALSALSLAAVPIAGSTMVWAGLRMSGAAPLTGFWLRLQYNVLVLAFVAVSFLPLGPSCGGGAVSEPVVKAFKVKKMSTYAWGAAALVFLGAMELLVVLELTE